MSNGKCGLCGREITAESDLYQWCKRCKVFAIPECAQHAYEVIDICTFCNEKIENQYKESKMKPKLILVHGKARSGKGEVAKRLCEKYGYVEVGFADYLKELAVEVFGWRPSEIWVNRTPESRKFMQLLGNEIGRAKDPSFWIKKLAERLKGKYKDRNVVVSDLRYWNEAAWGSHNGGQLWLVKRPDAEKMIEANPEHISERDLEKGIDWDETIMNDSTIEDLYRKVDEIMEKSVIIEKKAEVKSDNKGNDEVRALLLQDLTEIFVNSPMDGQTLNKIAMGLDALGWKKGRTLPRRKWK